MMYLKKAGMKYLLLLLPLLFISDLVFSQQLMAGAAKRIITPDPLLPVSGGVGKPRPAHIKKGDLYVRAVVLEKGDMKTAIVQVDNLGWPKVLGDKSRAMIKGIPSENILIGATHTHSAPDAYDFPDETGKTYADLNYLDWVSVQIADAVKEARANLRPVKIRTAVGKAEGKIAYNYYAPQLYDPRCGVIQGVDLKDDPVFTLVNYAIHPEVIGNEQDILSPDLVGPLNDLLEEKAGGISIFMNSAQGGMVTADNRLPGGGEVRDWEECNRIGRLLGEQALKIIDTVAYQINPNLFVAHKTIKFPVDNPQMRLIAKYSRLDYKMTHDTATTFLNLINLGKAQIITIPGEALPNIGYFLKRKMNTDQPFLFGLTNDAFGYILDRIDFDSFDRYKYVSRTGLGPETGPILIKTILAFIKEEPKP